MLVVISSYSLYPFTSCPLIIATQAQGIRWDIVREGSEGKTFRVDSAHFPGHSGFSPLEVWRLSSHTKGTAACKVTVGSEAWPSPLFQFNLIVRAPEIESGQEPSSCFGPFFHYCRVALRMGKEVDGSLYSNRSLPSGQSHLTMYYLQLQVLFDFLWLV